MGLYPAAFLLLLLRAEIQTESDTVASFLFCFVLQFSSSQEEEEIDMDTVHDSQAFISHHLNMLERPSTPGKVVYCVHPGGGESPLDATV